MSAPRLAALALIPAAAAIAGFFALAWIPAVFLDDLVLPSGLDAFYHARRILDAVDAPWAVAQFDPRIHAPEGAWVPWPWGFDALLALMVRVLRDAAGLDPATALVLVPPAWLLVNAALLVGVCRELRLPVAAQWIAALCFAFSPLTQNLHAVGQVDHHFLEYSFVLATLWAGLWCLREPARARPAATLGAVLGAANAVHNGLFVLQLPVLATFGLLWIRGCAPSPRAAAALALALVAGTLLAALPADALHAGLVDYRLLSWFHVYAACLTALALGLMARLSARPARVAGVLGVLAVAALPLAREVGAGVDFVTAELYRGWEASEMRAPFAGILGPRGADVALRAFHLYSALVFLLPLSLAAALVEVARGADPRRTCLAVFSLFGATLMLQQFRFHHFGSFALYLLPLAQLSGGIAAGLRAPGWLGLAALAALAPVTGAGLLAARSPPPGSFPEFRLTRSLYPILAEACQDRPGIVLAHHLDGHHVRFLTDCAVIANVLVVDRHAFEKLDQARRLFGLAPAELSREAPWVRYVLVRREDDPFVPLAPEEALGRNSPLRQSLLFSDSGWPPGYRLLGEVRLGGDRAGTVAARLFEIVPAAAPAGSRATGA